MEELVRYVNESFSQAYATGTLKVPFVIACKIQEGNMQITAGQVEADRAVNANNSL